MYFDQTHYYLRFEWGERGIEAIAPASDVVLITDVLSFSTCVAVATARGALVYPFAGAGAAEFAQSRGAHLAAHDRQSAAYSLSPRSLLALPAGSRLVLPSANGSPLTLAARAAAPEAVIMAGCWRNARAVASAAARLGRRIAIIAAGERWPADGSLRPAVEDLMGAGAIIDHLPGSRSPEAEIAVAAFQAAQPDLPGFLARSSSGRELIERGFAEDVALAAELDADACVPRLMEGNYFAWRR